MNCPICVRHKAKRFCPPKGASICSVCCGTEREVTIDCPSDCPYLIASRQYDSERREDDFDWSALPFPDVRIDPSFAREHGLLLLAISHAVCIYAHDHRAVVDSDVTSVLVSLAEAYRTLASGIYYEKLPDPVLQRGLYEAVRDAVNDHREEERERRMGVSHIPEGAIRDAFIALAQGSVRHSNGRAKGRAFLDFLRRQFRSEEFSRPASSIVLP